jgi:hypothetical protein
VNATIYCTECGIDLIEENGFWYLNPHGARPWAISPRCPWCRSFCPCCGCQEHRVGEDGLRRCEDCKSAEAGYDPARLAHADLSWLHENAPAEVVARLELPTVKRARTRASGRSATLADLAELERTRSQDIGGLWRVPALITEIETTQVKRGWHEGREMGFLTLEHGGRQRRVVIWPDELAAYREIFVSVGLLVRENEEVRSWPRFRPALLGEYGLRLKWSDRGLDVHLKGCRGYVDGCLTDAAAAE